MVYLVITRQGHVTESRRAVVTLDEARVAVLDPCRATGAAQLAADTAGKPRWNGGTVGPLPDGTLIDVLPIANDQLRAAVASHLDGAYERPLTEIADAFNAHQEALAR